MASYLLIAIAFLLFTTFIFFFLTNSAQKDVYMDEIFHVPQAQKYCEGNFSHWDPMITTLPGLYLASLPVLYPVALVFTNGDLSSVCSTPMLRSVNILFSLANFYLLYLLAFKLHFNHKNASHVTLTAVALATFPFLYFFTFLYYTDPVAVFFALLTYFWSLQSNHLLAAVAGVIAVICRQTNIVWVVFAAGMSCGKILLAWIQLDKKQEDGEERQSDWAVLSKTLSLIARSFQHNPKGLVTLGMEVFKTLWSYIMVGVMFIAFVIVNDGIVVGDRSNHQPCLNFPQMFYFLFTTAFFSCMHMVSGEKVKKFLLSIIGHPIKMATFVLAAVLFISQFMFIHEYNLADNRHYNFYFLSKIIQRNKYSKFILIPAYYYAFVSFYDLLQHKDVFWKLSYFICTLAAIIPQRMIEFRYFILPYLIFRLNMQMTSKLSLMLEVFFYLMINAWTVYMYIYKPFLWGGKNSVQRFMW